MLSGVADASWGALFKGEGLVRVHRNCLKLRDAAADTSRAAAAGEAAAAVVAARDDLDTVLT